MVACKRTVVLHLCVMHQWEKFYLKGGINVAWPWLNLVHSVVMPPLHQL